MIATERLELVPATADLTRAALEGDTALARRLRAFVPATWPPDLFDRPALEYTLDRLEQGADQAGWWLYFVVLQRGPNGRTLVGSAGYKGPPADGTVEVGYAIVRDHQREGYASEAVRGLLERAFSIPGVQRVIAETLPELTPSIGVLRKCGFRFIGDGSEPGVIRYELARADYSPGSTMPVPPKPSGYSTVSPYLIAAGAQAVIDFLKRTFAAQELRRYDRPDGSVMHAEVRIGDTVVMLADAMANWPAVSSHLHVYVDDVDSTYRRALEAGGAPVQPPDRKASDPDRRGGVRDPAGNTWWVATQVE